MKKETKQTLISLSLAGAIGYYLYNKLVKAGLCPSMMGGDCESAEERTKKELSMRPEAIVEEPVVLPELEIEPVVEEVVEEPAEAVEPEIEVAEAIEEAEPEAEEAEIVEDAVPSGVVCASCGALNADGSDVCAFCGSSMATQPEEVKDEEDLDAEIVAEPELITPDLDLGAVEPEIVVEEIEAVEEIAIDELPAEEEEPSVEDLMDAVQEGEQETVQEEPAQEESKLMDNVEPLHKVDPKSESAKKEFKSILDFFKTL